MPQQVLVLRRLSINAAPRAVDDRLAPEIVCQGVIKRGECSGTAHNSECQDVVVVGYTVRLTTQTRFFFRELFDVGLAQAAGPFEPGQSSSDVVLARQFLQQSTSNYQAWIAAGLIEPRVHETVPVRQKIATFASTIKHTSNTQ